MHHFAFRLLLASLILCSSFAAITLAQTPTPSPSQEATKPPDKPRVRKIKRTRLLPNPRRHYRPE